MSRVVLDASALLAMLNAEPGADRVAASLPEAAISAVNLSEVVAKLAELGLPQPEIHEALDPLGLDIVAFDETLAFAAGELRRTTRALGLSLGDRACLALGLALGSPVLTAERSWRKLGLPHRVELLR